MDVSNRRIVILGKTGAGKSSVANTIVRKKRFKIGLTAKSKTRKCRAETKSVKGKKITVIDTPGLFDTDRPEEKLKSEIVKCITKFSPGPHAFLIVFKVERFTEHEQAVINKINQLFSEEVFKYATVLFTHGEQLEEEQKIKDFIRGNKLLSDLVKKCGGRCHVIDNKYWKKNQQDKYRSNRFQVKELLNTIEKMIEANEGRCFTNETQQAVEEMIKQEEKRIRQSSGNKSEKKIREKAEVRTSKKLVIVLAGFTTGAVLGALFGGVVLVRVVHSDVTSYKPLAPAAAAVGGAETAAAAGAAAVGAGETAAGGGAAGGTAAGGAAAGGGAAGGKAAGGAAETAAAGGAAAGGTAAGGAAETAVAGAAAVGGGAAAGETAAVAGKSATALTVTSAAVGAVAGGVKV